MSAMAAAKMRCGEEEGGGGLLPAPLFAPPWGLRGLQGSVGAHPLGCSSSGLTYGMTRAPHRLSAAVPLWGPSWLSSASCAGGAGGRRAFESFLFIFEMTLLAEGSDTWTADNWNPYSCTWERCRWTGQVGVGGGIAARMRFGHFRALYGEVLVWELCCPCPPGTVWVLEGASHPSHPLDHPMSSVPPALSLHLSHSFESW